MSRQSLAKAHQKIQELSWEPQYHEPYMKYGTDYTFKKAAKKDPLKQVLRSYFPMQEEKDNRVYGASDGAIRGNMFRQVQERWLEWQKLFLSIIPLPEISAARSMPMLFQAVPNPELHNGQAIQMIDEVRHSTIQQNLKRLYMNNYIDPAGFNNTLRNFHSDYCGTIGRQFAEGFITGDAITAASIYLTIVAETAFTNTLFVAMPAEAAANGDYLLPTVFHSVQSDESRHISNGYATLLMALSDEGNRQLLERDLRYAWWNNHRVVDAAIGTFIEYGTKDRRKDRESYAEMWRRWIYDDYYRAYLLPLEKYGLVIPHDLIEESWNQNLEQGLRPRGRAVLRHRLARQLLAHRRHDRRRTSSGSSTSTRAGTTATASGGRTTAGSRSRTGTTRSWPRTSTTCTRTAAGPAWSRAWCARTWSSTRWTASGARTATRPAAGRTPWRSARRTRAATPPTWASSSATASGRRSTTAGTGPTSSRTWASSATTARRITAQPHLDLDPKKMWTLDHLRRMARTWPAPTSSSTR